MSWSTWSLDNWKTSLWKLIRRHTNTCVICGLTPFLIRACEWFYKCAILIFHSKDAFDEERGRIVGRENEDLTGFELLPLSGQKATRVKTTCNQYILNFPSFYLFQSKSRSILQANAEQEFIILYEFPCFKYKNN